MSAFNSNIVTVLTTERFGFGATLNPDGSISAITGATIEYVTAAPAAVRNGGSLALRNDGTLYGTAGAGTWFPLGGVATGWNLPDNVPGIWGTTAPGQASSVYVSASNRFDLQSGDISQATAATATSVRLGTGTATITGAVAGGDSGFVQLRTGATNCTNAGGTGGNSGTLAISTGAATSTLGTSGNTGAITIGSGNSDDGSSGSVAISTGTSPAASGAFAVATGAAAGAGNSGTVALASGTTATGTTGNVTIASGAATGAGTSGNISLTPGTVVGGTRGVVTALGLRTTSSTAGAITGVTVLVNADSGGVFSVSQAAAYDIDLPAPAGAGERYLFYLTGPAANSVTITVAGGAATFVGTIVNDVTSVIPATGSTLTFVTGTAALGDNIEAVSISSTLYLIRAVTSAAGGITIA